MVTKGRDEGEKFLRMAKLNILETHVLATYAFYYTLAAANESI